MLTISSSFSDLYTSINNLFGKQQQPAGNPTPPDNNSEIRASYNVKISAAYEGEFKEKFANFHAKEQCFGPDLAREAYETRNAIKEQHQEQTSTVGRAAIAVRNLFKYGTLGNVGYDQLVQNGKNPEEIAYSAFKTGGGDLGLGNNGFGETLEVWEAIKDRAPHFYPENITPEMITAYKAQIANKQIDVDALLAAGEPDQCEVNLGATAFLPKKIANNAL